MKKLAWWLVGILGVQYLLGLLAGMFEEIPTDNPESVFMHLGYIHVHALTGALLLLLAIVFLVKAYKTKTQLMTAWVGLIGIVAAAIAGQVFVHTQNDTWSIVMGVTWLVAYSCYLVAAVKLQQSIRK